MKKTIAIMLSLIMLVSVCLLAGCGKTDENGETPETPAAADGIDTSNWTEAQLYSWATVKYDETAAEPDGLYINAKDGSCWVSFNFANSDSEYQKNKEQYEAVLTNESYSDVNTTEKTLGDYTYQATTYVGNGQFFGFYFAVLDPAVAPAGGFDPVQSIKVNFYADDPAMLDTIEAIIGTLQIIPAE